MDEVRNNETMFKFELKNPNRILNSHTGGWSLFRSKTINWIKNPWDIPTIKNPGNKNPETKRSRMPGQKSRDSKNPNPGDLPKIPGFFIKSRENLDGQKTVKTKNFYMKFFK